MPLALRTPDDTLGLIGSKLTPEDGHAYAHYGNDSRGANKTLSPILDICQKQETATKDAGNSALVLQMYSFMKSKDSSSQHAHSKQSKIKRNKRADIDFNNYDLKPVKSENPRIQRLRLVNNNTFSIRNKERTLNSSNVPQGRLQFKENSTNSDDVTNNGKGYQSEDRDSSNRRRYNAQSISSVLTSVSNANDPHRRPLNTKDKNCPAWKSPSPNYSGYVRDGKGRIHFKNSYRHHSTFTDWSKPSARSGHSKGSFEWGQMPTGSILATSLSFLTLDGAKLK